MGKMPPLIKVELSNEEEDKGIEEVEVAEMTGSKFQNEEKNAF